MLELSVKSFDFFLFVFGSTFTCRFVVSCNLKFKYESLSLRIILFFFCFIWCCFGTVYRSLSFNFMVLDLASYARMRTKGVTFCRCFWGRTVTFSGFWFQARQCYLDTNEFVQQHCHSWYQGALPKIWDDIVSLSLPKKNPDRKTNIRLFNIVYVKISNAHE